MPFGIPGKGPLGLFHTLCFARAQEYGVLGPLQAVSYTHLRAHET